MEFYAGISSRVITRHIQGNRTAKRYPISLRRFALTLRFLSSQAYDYVRDKFKNLLPHPATLRKWYQVIEGKPGFTKEAFETIRMVTAKKKEKLIVSLVMDEMSIRNQVSYKNGEHYGFVDLGCNIIQDQSDNRPEAKNALVFLAVSVTWGWKIPIAYFLIAGLTAKERANLVTMALDQLHEVGAEVCNITFDGSQTNISTCKHLGADFRLGSNFAPFFKHPVTGKKVYTIWDPPHMLKLIRNAFAETGPFLDSDGKEISLQHIVLLHAEEELQGLKAATKLTDKHVLYENNKMNVRLAAQTLSESMSAALEFINDKSLNLSNIPDTSGTAKFCKFVNDAFDLLNVRSPYTIRPAGKPIESENEAELLKAAKEITDYISSLKYPEENKFCLRGAVVRTTRCTGFLGFVVDLHNIFEIWREYLLPNGYKYLLTYKLCQDFLETFFGSIRRRGGFNNNPDSYQFRAAYRMLLIHTEIKCSESANILPDDIQILTVSSARKKQPTLMEKLIAGVKQRLDDEVTDEEVVEVFLEDIPEELSAFNHHIVRHIAGLVSKEIAKQITCEDCQKAFPKSVIPKLSSDTSLSLLSRLKSHGSLTKQNEDVAMLCIESERLFRKHKDKSTSANFIEILITKVIKNIGGMILFKNECIFEDHRQYLICSICNYYIKIRLHHETTKYGKKKSYIRQKMTKLVTFMHQ